MHNVASGLIVHEAMVRKNLMAELPFMATENIMMACVKAGGDRQEYHEKIRVHAQAAGWRRQGRRPRQRPARTTQERQGLLE